jgi:Mg-chelatase subunit ChlD/plastocyanin
LQKKLLIISILIFLLALIIFFPKTTILEDDFKLQACKCIGLNSKNSCLGIKTDCLIIDKTKDRSNLIKKNLVKGYEITLLFDQSKSMAGPRLIEAKSAANELIDSMSEDDRMSIISFDINANVIQDFTNDKELLKNKIKTISANEETSYVSALTKALNLYKKNSNSKVKKIIFLSDGEPSKNEKISEIYEQVYSLTNNNLCLYTIGYGDDVSDGSKAENILLNMADISIERNKCGNYYRSSENWNALTDIFNHIYSDMFDKELLIKINEPSKYLYLTDDILFNISTNVDAICSYNLNNQYSELIFNENLKISAKPGLNSLKLICKKSFGNEETKEITKEFFVKLKPFSKLNKETIKTNTNVKKLDNHEIQFLLEDIIEKQELNIVKKMSPKGKGTLIYLILENTKPVKLNNIHIKQIIPNNIVNKIDSISSTSLYEILKIDPIELEFTFSELKPDEIITLNYYIDKKISSKDLNDIKTEVRYDEITAQAVKDMIILQNNTKQFFDIEKGFKITDGNTKGQINLNPKTEIDDLKIYLNIPKCMALHINQIHFKNKNYKVVSEDPLIFWQLSNTKDDFNIEYDLDKELEKECEDKISVLTIGKPVEQNFETINKPKNTLIYFFPLLIIFLVIIVIANKKVAESETSKEKIKLIKMVLIITLIVFLVYFIYPKDKFKNDMLCNCFGVSNTNDCFGISYNCNVPRSFLEVETSTLPECYQDCENLRRYMNLDPYSRIEAGTDLLLLLDRSKSMEETNKMQHAKAALINLVSKIEENNRISIVQFDDKSELIQHFTTNKKNVVSSINGIKIGLTTKYIPALTTAHQNFLNYGDRRNQWQLIFVSDGEPKDSGKPNSIYQKVKEMADDEICINTIGFGSEITPGSDAETTLKEMARISNEITGCGVYYYSEKEMESLSKVLGKMYEESQIKRLGLDIDMTINSLQLSENENFNIKANLYSQINSQEIPGKFQIGTDEYCTPPADLKLILKDRLIENSVKKSYDLLYDSTQKAYIFENNLEQGDYETELKAEVSSKGITCDIGDSVEIGNLKISKNTGFKTCNTDECNEINKYLFSNLTKKVLNIYITDFAYVPQNVSITSGTIVVWKNIGKKPHTVTSGENVYSGKFHSGILYPGDSFNFSFKDEYNQNYFDNFSKKIRGGMNLNISRNYSIGNFSLEYKQNIDLSLLIDRSGSMSGSKLENLKSASEKLINIVYPGDRVSVIKFSDDANIANLFTYDKTILKKTISDLHAAGNTKYIPAFYKAKENYEQYGRNSSGKIIIFLSDGEPWDHNSPYSIYNAVDELLDDEICIYAIGYGEEVFEGSQSELILKNIVEQSKKSVYCGNYKYSPSSELQLTKIFGSIYHEAIGELDGLKLETNINKMILFDNESLDVKTKVKSSFNNNYLPGFINDSNFQLCGPPAKVTASLMNSRGKNVYNSNLKYIGPTTGYHVNIIDLKPGQYTLELKAESITSEKSTCNYIGYESIPITVVSSETYSVNPLFLIFIAGLIITFFSIFLTRKSD